MTMTNPDTPDPMYGEMPDRGEVRFGFGAHIHGYMWAKASTVEVGHATCGACEEPITGRTFMVAPIQYIRPGQSTSPVWRHVKCVTPDDWHAWLGAPRSAPSGGFTPSKAPKNSARAAAIEAARVNHDKEPTP